MNQLKKIKQKFYNFTHPQMGVILMLHRVISERSKIKLNNDLEITPEFLEKIIVEYKQKGFKFVSPDEVYELMTGKKRIKEQFVCFTFDDGYKDNLEVAYPVFYKYDCPFTIYVTKDFIEQKAVIWWYVLEDILLQNDSISLSDGTVFTTESMEEKDVFFKKMHEKLSILEPSRLRKTFEDLFSNYTFSFEEKVRDLSLSKEQLKEVGKSSLCTIGAHTVSHPRLSTLNIEKQKEEIYNSKEYFESITNKTVDHFAYPFGSYNDDSVELVTKAGYKTAVMAWGGTVRKGQNTKLLYRINLTQIEDNGI